MNIVRSFEGFCKTLSPGMSNLGTISGIANGLYLRAIDGVVSVQSLEVLNNATGLIQDSMSSITALLAMPLKYAPGLLFFTYRGIENLFKTPPNIDQKKSAFFARHAIKCAAYPVGLTIVFQIMRMFTSSVDTAGLFMTSQIGARVFCELSLNSASVSADYKGMNKLAKAIRCATIAFGIINVVYATESTYQSGLGNLILIAVPLYMSRTGAMEESRATA